MPNLACNQCDYSHWHETYYLDGYECPECGEGYLFVIQEDDGYDAWDNGEE